MNERVKHYLTQVLWHETRQAEYYPDCNCDGYHAARMVEDEITRPPFTKNPELEASHSDWFKERMAERFSYAKNVLELQELLAAEEGVCDTCRGTDGKHASMCSNLY